MHSSPVELRSSHHSLYINPKSAEDLSGYKGANSEGSLYSFFNIPQSIHKQGTLFPKDHHLLLLILRTFKRKEVKNQTHANVIRLPRSSRTTTALSDHRILERRLYSITSSYNVFPPRVHCNFRRCDISYSCMFKCRHSSGHPCKIVARNYRMP